MSEDVAWELGKGLDEVNTDLSDTEAELVSAQDRISELGDELREAQGDLSSERERMEELDGRALAAEEALETDTQALILWGLGAGGCREDVQLLNMEASEFLREANLKQGGPKGCWHTTTTHDATAIWCVGCGLTRQLTSNPADRAALAEAAGKILAADNEVKVPSPPTPPRSDPRAVALEGFV